MSAKIVKATNNRGLKKTPCDIIFYCTLLLYLFINLICTQNLTKGDS